jgi:predicted aspartyl protease
MTVFGGAINDRLWPLMPLVVSGDRISFWALIDTGFEGYLMVPDHERGRLRVARTGS